VRFDNDVGVLPELPQRHDWHFPDETSHCSFRTRNFARRHRSERQSVNPPIEPSGNYFPDRAKPTDRHAQCHSVFLSGTAMVASTPTFRLKGFHSTLRFVP
jgi:hypothetical protein